MPAVWRDRVIVGSEDGNIYAVSAQGGRELWCFATEGHVRSSPRIYEDLLYVGADDGYLYLLNPEDGQMLWRFRTYGVVRSAPAFAHGLVILGSADESAMPSIQSRALRSGVGAQEAKKSHRRLRTRVTSMLVAWMRHSITWLPSPAGSLGARAHSDPSSLPPCVVDDRVYVGSTDDYLYCFNRRTGKRYWWYPAGDQVASSPVHARGILYFGSANGAVFTVDVASGKQRWRFETSDVVTGTPLVHDGVVYIGSAGGSIYALAAQA